MSINLMPRVHAPIATKSPTMRALQDRFADIINVKDFGATGDGETDDTEAFVAAVASITGECLTAADTVQLVFIPPGNYLLTEDVDGFFFSFGGVTITGSGTIKHFNLFSILNSLDLSSSNVIDITSLTNSVTSLTSSYNTLSSSLTTVQKTVSEQATKLEEIESAYQSADEELSAKIDEVEESSQTRTLKVEWTSNASSTSQSTSNTTANTSINSDSDVTVDYNNSSST